MSAPAVNVLTQHNDNSRTGANLSEFILNVSNVNTGQFGKLFSRAVDGQIYAQPLYVNSLVISNKLHNVVYVATEHNSVYAFDADDPSASNALWHVNLGPTTPSSELICNDITPEIGITSTPVIDLTTTTMYVCAKTKEIAGTVTNYFYRLHALDTLTGQEKFGGPVVVQGSVPGTGIGSDGTNVSFNTFLQWNRSGILLLSNVVHVAFGEACNTQLYHGWLFSYNATNLQRLAIFCTTPNGVAGGIWASGMGPSVDADGYIYVATANGTFDKDTGGLDIGDTVIKFGVSNGIPQVADWFTPHDQGVLFTNDLDLGAGGPVVVPSTNLLVEMGKVGEVYLLNRQHLGGYVTYSTDTNIVQEFLAYNQPYFIGESPVYWKGPTNEFIYFWSFGIPLTAYKFTGTMIVTNPVAVGTVQTVPRVGGISLSANGNAAGSGILWGTEASSNGVLHAYKAENVAHELWNSQQIAARDALGNYVKFCAPTIVNGKVYVPTTSNALVVYGLLAPWQSVSPTNYDFGTVATGTTTQTTFVVTDLGGGPLTGTVATAGPFAIVSGGSYTVVSGGSTNVVVSFTPTSPGSFTNNVIFTSNGGNTTNTVIGAGAVAPTAGFTAHPIAGTEPLGVTFSDTSTGTPPLTLYWNLGDSVLVTNSGGANFNHTYDAGIYTVSLTASNAFGTSTLVSNNLIAVVTALQAWQLHYFGCTNCPQAQPNADLFGTGMSNTNKFLAGFNPTNPVAYLRVISVATTNTSDITVMYLGANGDNTWSPGIASRTNVLEFTAGTAGGGYSNDFVSANVTNILSGGTGTGLVTNMVDAGGATNTPSRYYRIRVLVP